TQQMNHPGTTPKSFTGPVVTVNSPVVIENFDQTAVGSATTLERFVGFINANASIVVLIWAVFFLFHCIKLITGLAGIQRMRNYRSHASPDEWRIRLDQLSETLGLKQSILLLQSEIVKVPVAIGFLKPIILVPLGLLSNLPAEQVETILLHELAHIRRKDYLVNIMQRFVEAVFFFNPALIWISSLLRQEREACCDDIVVAHTRHKGSYLEALVSFQEYCFATSQYAMAIHSNKHYLLNRVKRMITRENKKLDIMEKIVLIAGLISFTAFTLIPREHLSVKSVPASSGNVNGEVVASATVNQQVSSEPETVRKTIKRKEPKKAVAEKLAVEQSVIDKPAVEKPVTILPADTVPPLKKGNEKEKTESNEL